MNSYFSYTRVSTTKQGQTGVSLAEQRGDIQRYAERNNLKVMREYVEQETAAKTGRPVFAEMIKAVKREKVSGILIHKVDRSARNYHDWANVGDLLDDGIEVHFVSDNIDLNTRGGRLVADMQALVAVDYIRNLREEVKKGIRGRLKQGLLPLPAPLGYLDCGKGKPKALDPERGPLMRHAFELYSSGTLGLRELADQMYELGLRRRSGGKLYKTGLAGILRNPFYAGVIRIKKTGEIYSGAHEPIISQQLFDRVQARLDGKLSGNKRMHNHLFRRIVHCAECSRLLIGERHKGRVYYRCQTSGCGQKTMREDALETAVREVFKQLRFTDGEGREIRNALAELWTETGARRERDLRLYNLQLENVRSRLSTLADAYIEGTFDKATYLEKKNSYVWEEQTVVGKIEGAKRGEDGVLKEVERILELANDAYLSWKDADCDDKRELIETVFSNLEVRDKSLMFKLNSPFQMVSDRRNVLVGAPSRNTARMISTLISKLCEHFNRLNNADYGKRLKSLDRISMQSYNESNSSRTPTVWRVSRKR